MTAAGHKQPVAAGILLRRSKGKGSVMTRMKRGTTVERCCRVFPLVGHGFATFPRADAFTRPRPAARVKAGRLAALVVGRLDGRGSRRGRIGRSLVASCHGTFENQAKGMEARKGGDGEGNSGERSEVEPGAGDLL